MGLSMLCEMMEDQERTGPYHYHCLD